MKNRKIVLGKYTYFGKLASLLVAVIATFCLLAYAEPKKITYLITKINFYAAWFINAFIAYLIIRFTIWGTRLLDRLHPWQRSYHKRWPKQLLLAISIPLLLCTICLVIYFLVYKKNILETNFFNSYLFLDTLAIFVLNGALFFMHQKQANDRRQPKLKSQRDAHIVFPFPLADIAYLYAEDKNCYVINFQAEIKHLDVSLTKALPSLPQEQFFMVRRSHVVNRAAIKRLIKRNNTIKVVLLPKLKLGVMVSRLEMSAFETWWDDYQEEITEEQK